MDVYEHFGNNITHYCDKKVKTNSRDAGIKEKW